MQNPKAEAQKWSLTSPGLFCRLPVTPFLVHFGLLALFLIARFYAPQSLQFSAWLLGVMLSWVHHFSLRNLWHQELQQPHESTQNLRPLKFWSLAAIRRYLLDIRSIVAPIAFLAILAGGFSLLTFFTSAYMFFLLVRGALEVLKMVKAWVAEEAQPLDEESFTFTPFRLAGSCPVERKIFRFSSLFLGLILLPQVLKFYLRRLGFLLFRGWCERKDGIGLIFQDPNLDEAPLWLWKVLDILIFSISIGIYNGLWFLKYAAFYKDFDLNESTENYQSSRHAHVTLLSDKAIAHELSLLLLLCGLLTLVAFWYHFKCMVYARYLRYRHSPLSERSARNF